MQDEGQRDRTPGKAVYGLPVAGATGVCAVQSIVGILVLPCLPETGADPGSLPGDPGQETGMRRGKMDDYYRTGNQTKGMRTLSIFTVLLGC